MENWEENLMADDYKQNSITPPGAIAMGTVVKFGSRFFALTGQIAGLSNPDSH